MTNADTSGSRPQHPEVRTGVGNQRIGREQSTVGSASPRITFRFNWSTVGIAFFLTEDEDAGGYTVEVPQLPGVHTQGETVDEAITNAEEALRAVIGAYLARDMDVPIQSVRDPSASEEVHWRVLQL